MKRWKSNVKTIILLICAGAFYTVWLLLGGIGIPCIFKKITGLMCPGCGISHIALSLIRLDLKSAFNANPFIFITSPYLLMVITYEMGLKERIKLNKKIYDFVACVYVVALLLFGVIRNIQ